MKESVKNFLSSLEGYHQTLKGIHWSTKCKAEHLLTDEIDGDILTYEDRIAEACMGIMGSRLAVGDLKALVPEGKELKSVLKEMEKDVQDFKDFLGEAKKYAGVHNILDDFAESIAKWKYLEDFS